MMTKDEMDKYAYIQMVKNNPDEAVKELIRLQQENERLKEDKIKAIKYINENKHLSMFADCREPEEDWNYDLECSANDLLNILQGSDKE